jgi:hypothetical protein
MRQFKPAVTGARTLLGNFAVEWSTRERGCLVRWRSFARPPTAYFTSTFMRIQGWMQHSKRCSPFDRPVTLRSLP